MQPFIPTLATVFIESAATESTKRKFRRGRRWPQARKRRIFPLNSKVKTNRCFFVSLDALHPDLNIQAFSRMKLREILALRHVKLFWAEICETLWNFQCLWVWNVKWHVVLASFLEWGYCVVSSHNWLNITLNGTNFCSGLRFFYLFDRSSLWCFIISTF